MYNKESVIIEIYRADKVYLISKYKWKKYLFIKKKN